MHFEQTWRWFGTFDTINLDKIKQTSIDGIVTGLHHLPPGTVWSISEIKKRKKHIENAGLHWSVVESLPVHEDIKKQSGNFETYVKNYQQSIYNLAQCDIHTICYNFMPLTDWTRTDVNYPLADNTTTLRFDKTAFTAFELFILKRDKAEQQYSTEQQKKAKTYYDSLNDDEISTLKKTVLLGLPGDEEMTLEKFRFLLNEYQYINAQQLRSNLYYFLKKIIPVAEENEVKMVIHPDDPPFSLFGLPRIVNTEKDTYQLLKSIDSSSNGFTFCSGSYGASADNDLPGMIKRLGHRINFIHLRSVKRDKDGSFQEARHLEGDTDMFHIMYALIKEQQRRKLVGRSDFNIPIRPDHGHRMLDDLQRESYPGYSGLGRLKGMAELRGLEYGIRKMMTIQHIKTVLPPLIPISNTTKEES
jgi:mannonate dehydratase